MLGILFLLGSCGAADSDLQPLDPEFKDAVSGKAEVNSLGRTIVARGDHAYAPFEYLDAAGRPAGFNIDLLRRVAEVMGLSITIDLGPWDQVRGEIERGEIDMLAGMYKTPERDRLVDFTVPQFTTFYGFFTEKAPKFEDLEELRGYRIAVQTGDVGHDFLLDKGFGPDLVEFGTWEDIFRAVKAGTADYALASMVQSVRLIEDRNFKSLHRVGPPFLQEKYCMAVREGDAELLAALNEGLSILKASGEYDRIYETWFGVDADTGQRTRRILRILAVWLGLALFFSILVLFWIILLRRQVLIKTAQLSRELAAREETQRKLEAAVREAERLRTLAEEANRSKSAFLAGISHELRTPLHGVIGLGRLLERSSLSEDQARLLAMLQGAAEQLERLITDLLDLTRAATGKLSLSPELFPLGKLAEWMEESLRQSAKERGLDLSFTILNPSLVIRADRNRLSQIVLNLANNGIKYSDRGEVSVRVSHAEGNLEIEVADTGPGIGDADRSRIFEAFYQIPTDSPSENRGGLGLGLSIVKTLVDLMKGSTSVRDRPGGGSVFTVTIPLESVAPRQGPDSAVGAGKGEPDLKGVSVLVAEDEGINALYLRRILEERGLIVETVADGEAAVRRRMEGKPDLILMDMGLPLLDGIGAVRRIRELERDGGPDRVPIVALTANAYQQDRDACREAGMDGFLAKPFVESALWAEIRRVLGGSKQP